MRAAETAARLTEFAGRGAGTDAERRAAQWLARELRAARRQVELDTFWCRPNWALAHAWHCGLGVVGSLLTVSHPVLGGALVLAALLSILLDELTGHSPGRRLTPERASQNVVSTGRDVAAAGRRNGSGAAPRAQDDDAVRLIVTANYDAGRAGLAYRDPLRRPAAQLKRLAAGGRLTPGWLGWLVLVLLWLVAVAVLRHTGSSGRLIGVLQLVPTAGLVVGLALLLELSASPFGPAAGDDAAGVAVALALVRALDASPPRRLRVELVLQGAGDGGMIGIRRHLRGRRRELRPRRTIVLGVGPCGAGRPCWWISDGPLVPLGYLARLRGLAEQVADQPRADEHRRPSGIRSRGTGPAFPARARGIPALTIGCADDRGLAPRSHQRDDVPEALEPVSLDLLLEFALTLVDALDADLAKRHRPAGEPRRPVSPAAPA